MKLQTSIKGTFPLFTLSLRIERALWIDHHTTAKRATLMQPTRLLVRVCKSVVCPLHSALARPDLTFPRRLTGNARVSSFVERSAKVCAPGLVKLITAVAYHFCPGLPAAFTQPGSWTFADLCKMREVEREREEGANEPFNGNDIFQSTGGISVVGRCNASVHPL